MSIIGENSRTQSLPPTPPVAPPRTSYFSPILREKETREIIMGGLVTPGGRRLDSTNANRDEEKNMGMMERRVEVPGIVLTAPMPDLPLRSPSPPMKLKQTVLLPPSSLPIPLNSHIPRKPAMGISTIRTMVLLVLIAVGGWHLWSAAGWGEEERIMWSP